jgi:hypothetical protein
VSVKERLEDARFLYENDRRIGAFLNVLVAVAATSRKRYAPETIRTDREAFETFVQDEMLVISDGGLGRLVLRVPNAGLREFPDDTVPFPTVLYKFVRCSLAHEGGLPDQVQFVPREPGVFTFEVNEEQVVMSDSVVGGLSKAVQFARENASLFPDTLELPQEIVAWHLFGQRWKKDSTREYMTQRRNRLIALGHEVPE